MSESIFIPQEIIEQVRAAADLVSCIEDRVNLTLKGASRKGDCPKCGAIKKLEVHKAKKLYKCFVCGFGGKDPVTFLMEGFQLSFQEAVTTLADKYNISLEKPAEKITPKQRHARGGSFRDLQLKESGISEKDQRILLLRGPGHEEEIDRYQSASIDKYWEIMESGDDMILHYVGLDRKLIYYRTDKGKVKPFFRIRHQFPAQKTDTQGNPMKYQSPYKGGNHLWIPSKLIGMYNSGASFDTLVVIEGEKKADKLMVHDIPAVGIAGIHNFSTGGEMITQFQQIISHCNVRNVIFMLDADWNDISAKPGADVDHRPKTFSKAVSKFKEYFTSYAANDIYLECYFGYGLDKAYKGMDDLMVRHLQKDAGKLKEDIEAAMIDLQGTGKYVRLHKVTAATDYKIQEFWSLHNKTAFFELHKDKLLELKVFKFNRIKHRVNENNEFELDQKLMPYEQYWREFPVNVRGRDKNIIEFDYVNIVLFLSNRGFGLYQHRPMAYRFIQIDNKIVREVNAHYIQHYVRDFTIELGKKDVLEMIYRGMKQYLGEANLSNMNYKTPQFWEPEPETQYFFFKSVYWKITKSGVEERPLNELPFHVWDNKIIDFEPKKLKDPIIQIDTVENVKYVMGSDEAAKSDIVTFLNATSLFHWQKLYEYDEEQGFYTATENPEKITLAERIDQHLHMISKMLAVGYVLHEYNDLSNMKAIIAVDGLESEVGRAEGGSGKSLFCTMFKHMIPTHIIDGKTPNLTNDQFIYDGVDERTQAIVFDDCRVNIDFEFFFSQITQGITVNSKGEKKFKIPAKKMIFTTNNMINGEGNSFDRRQFTIAFSDYYNSRRTPKDDFGRQLFIEWDHEQWNYFYHFMAACVMEYLRHGLSITIPKENLQKRKLRQKVGEDLLEWADLFFDAGGERINHEVEIHTAYNDFINSYPGQRKYVNLRVFKTKLHDYCIYREYEFNPQRKHQVDKRIRKNGKEFITVGDKNFDSSPLNIKQITF